MDVSSLSDDKGNVIQFKLYQGRKFHPGMVGKASQRVENIIYLKSRPDDVLLCTYPKSGTHWVFNIIKMLRSNSIEYRGSPDTIEYEDLAEMDLKDSPRTYHSHMTYPLIPEAAKDGRIKIVYVLRNPKDVMCSFYKYQKQLNNTLYKGTFDGFVNFFLSDDFPHCGGTWFTYVKEWADAKRTNRDLDILTLHYEDLVQNLYSKVVDLTRFLKVEHDDAFLRQVVEAVSFDNLKTSHAAGRGAKDTWKDWISDGILPIYRKGKVGDWRRTLTVAQNIKFDNVYQEKMAAMNTDLDFVFE